jgi:hypothetical protein
MSQQAAIDTLVEAFTAVPEYDNPLIPVYEALGQEQLARSGSYLHDLIDEGIAALLLHAIVRHVLDDADDDGPVFRLFRAAAKAESSANCRTIGEELAREALIDDE